MKTEEQKPGDKPAKTEEQKPTGESSTMDTGSITSSQISSSASQADDLIDKSLVSVRIKYPKDFQGSRFFHDEEVYEMSPESANEIIKQGIGKKC